MFLIASYYYKIYLLTCFIKISKCSDRLKVVLFVFPIYSYDIIIVTEDVHC